MEEKQEVAAAVIKTKFKMKKIIIFLCVFTFIKVHSQKETIEETAKDTSKKTYKKRVLESTEIDILSSYYSQDGDNSAVTGGIGTEELTDLTATYIIAIPLSDDEVLTIDVGASAYTSASSSNVDPFDDGPADPFTASSGSSSSDLWANITTTYSHSSDDRNDIWSATLSASLEYDYFSAGIGGSYTKLFNEKNTELSVKANVFIDTWNIIHPIELRNGTDDFVITGNTNYNPQFVPIDDTSRNTYSLGFGFSQILHKNIQSSLALDLIQQDGVLSTPFQRVYFADVADSFVDNFQLADDVERLPDSRFKIAIGGRLNWYLNERLTLRTFYRYYTDNWGVNSHTASVEIPIKISKKFTLYPSYRYYTQTAADYFAPANENLSTSEFYTSDYDLSKFNSNQFGFGVSYTDVLTKLHFLKFGLKSVDLKFYQHDRDTSFSSSIITTGVKFIMD